MHLKMSRLRADGAPGLRRQESRLSGHAQVFEDATDPKTAVGEHPEIWGGASGFLDALLFRHTGQAPGKN